MSLLIDILDNMNDHHNEAQAIHLGVVTTKVPPTYNGTSSWFEYEDALLDWSTYYELLPGRQGMAAKMRLTGYAADIAIVFAALDQRQALNQDDGLAYFIRTLRPKSVKGAAAVFLYRFIQLMQFRRGTGDMVKWQARLQTLLRWT